MTMKNDAKFEKDLTCHFKIDMMDLTSFEPSTWKSQNFQFNVLLLSKVYIFQAKKVQRSYLSRNWRGIRNSERNRLVVSKLAWGIWQMLTWVLESLKDFHFNGLLWARYILFELKMYRGVIFHDTDKWWKIWRKIDLLLGKWHEEFGKF